MTMFSSGARVRYIAAGATNFSVPWPFNNADHVLVIRRPAGSDVEEVLQLNVDYTLAPPTGPWTTAFVTIPVGAKNAAGDTIAILRFEPIQQAADYTANDSFPAESHEGALDWLAMLIARANERLGRALSIRMSDPLAGGLFDANSNRIGNLLDPVHDSDAATKSWVLTAIGNPVLVSPDSAIAQWNANKLYGRPIANVAPTDTYSLKWSATNGRWEPQPSTDATTLLASNNTWAGQNIFNGDTQVFNNLSMTKALASFNFSGLGQRIKGRFYGTPHTDRTLITSNAAAQDCVLGILNTGGGGSGSGVGLYGGTDPDNAPVLYLAAGPVQTLIQSSRTGGGVTTPLIIATDATTTARFATNGRMQLGTTADNGAQLNVNGMVSRDPAAVSVHRNGVAFNVPTTAFTKIPFSTEEYDTKGWYDIALQRFQPTVPGYYTHKASGGPDVGGAIGTRSHVSIFKNGVIYKTMSDIQNAGGGAVSSTGAVDVFLNGAGDYTELMAWQNTGANQSWGGLAQDCFLQITHTG